MHIQQFHIGALTANNRILEHTVLYTVHTILYVIYIEEEEEKATMGG